MIQRGLHRRVLLDARLFRALECGPKVCSQGPWLDYQNLDVVLL